METVTLNKHQINTIIETASTLWVMRLQLKAIDLYQTVNNVSVKQAVAFLKFGDVPEKN